MSEGNERDTDPHSMTMLEQLFVAAVVFLGLLVLGSCIVGG